MANIILNASDLLRVDLDGVMVLLPRLFKAIHAILSESTPKIKYVEDKIHITCVVVTSEILCEQDGTKRNVIWENVECIIRNIDCRCYDAVPTVELRRAAIHLLLSMLCLPLHFKTLTINRKCLITVRNVGAARLCFHRRL